MRDFEGHPYLTKVPWLGADLFAVATVDITMIVENVLIAGDLIIQKHCILYNNDNRVCQSIVPLVYCSSTGGGGVSPRLIEMV